MSIFVELKNLFCGVVAGREFGRQPFSIDTTTTTIHFAMTVNHSRSKALDIAGVILCIIGVIGLFVGVVKAISESQDIIYGEPAIWIGVTAGAFLLVVTAISMLALVPIARKAENDLAEDGDDGYIASENTSTQ